MSEDLSRRHLLIGAGVAALAAGCSQAASEAQTEASQSAAAAKPDTQNNSAPDLSGVSILITGCSSGFGRLGAEHYARLGAKVFATMRNLPRPEATELEALAKAENLDITVLEIDVTDDDQIAAGTAKAMELAGGSLDVLINNAGISYGGPIELQDMKATHNVFDTNVYGPHRMARAVLPAMRARGHGYIINISSQLGRVIVPGFGQYSPSKFALEAMSEQMAYELMPRGVEVTLVEPGGYPTKIWENAGKLTTKLHARLTDEQKSGYPQMAAMMETGRGGSGGGDTDPMDIPRAIAAMIAMDSGSRPLRKPVHPGMKPQLPINDASAKAQLAYLGSSPYGPMIKGVLD